MCFGWSSLYMRVAIPKSRRMRAMQSTSREKRKGFRFCFHLSWWNDWWWAEVSFGGVSGTDSPSPCESKQTLYVGLSTKSLLLRHLLTVCICWLNDWCRWRWEVPLLAIFSHSVNSILEYSSDKYFSLVFFFFFYEWLECRSMDEFIRITDSKRKVVAEWRESRGPPARQPSLRQRRKEMLYAFTSRILALFSLGQQPILATAEMRHQSLDFPT